MGGEQAGSTPVRSGAKAQQHELRVGNSSKVCRCDGFIRIRLQRGRGGDTIFSTTRGILQLLHTKDPSLDRRSPCCLCPHLLASCAQSSQLCKSACTQQVCRCDHHKSMEGARQTVFQKFTRRYPPIQFREFFFSVRVCWGMCCQTAQQTGTNMLQPPTRL